MCGLVDRHRREIIARRNRELPDGVGIVEILEHVGISDRIGRPPKGFLVKNEQAAYVGITFVIATPEKARIERMQVFHDRGPFHGIIEKAKATDDVRNIERFRQLLVFAELSQDGFVKPKRNGVLCDVRTGPIPLSGRESICRSFGFIICVKVCNFDQGTGFALICEHGPVGILPVIFLVRPYPKEPLQEQGTNRGLTP